MRAKSSPPIEALGAYLDGPIREKRQSGFVPEWNIRPFARATRAIVPAPIASLARRWYLTPRRLGPTAPERARVIEIYESDIRTLETLIHRDLSGWLNPEKPPS